MATVTATAMVTAMDTGMRLLQTLSVAWLLNPVTHFGVALGNLSLVYHRQSMPHMMLQAYDSIADDSICADMATATATLTGAGS